MRLLVGGVIITSIDAIFFVLTESNNIVQVARLHPAWAAYVLLLGLVALGVGVGWAVVRVREDRTGISISRIADAESSPGTMRARTYIAAAVAWLACSVVAVVWLSKISNGQ
jgi:hypothetical protein